MNDVLRGVLFSLGGNIAISIGDHLKVFGEQHNNGGKKLYHGKTMTKKRQYSGRFLFGILGYIVMMTGQISNGYALAFAPQTLLSCIGSVQFIMNLLCSSILMSRSIKIIHIVGTLSIIMGCLVMIFGFSPKTDTSSLTVYALFYNFNSYHYRNYLMLVVFIFICSIIWQYIESNYLHTSLNNSHPSPKCNNTKRRSAPTPLSINKQSVFCCMDPKLISGFFYSFSSAMTGTQSVVLGKTLAIIIRNYAAGKIVIFNPFDLFILCFILIVFLSFIVTFGFWLYRRTESMVLFDTVFIAPLNQVMWLTFSTVAGGIYFHEFENAYSLQWMALICGMVFNYVGLYYLVPTAADQPILIINMEKPPNKVKKKKKIDNDTQHTINININRKEHKPKRKRIKSNKNKKNVIITSSKSQSYPYPYDGYDSVHDKEHETEDDECDSSISTIDETDDTEEDQYITKHLRVDIENEENSEEIPLLNSITLNTNSKHKWYQVFAAKRR